MKSELIISGQVVLKDSVEKQQILIDLEKGTIKEVNPKIGIPDYEFSKDYLIFPGFIDIHVHCREDVTGKHNYKEDFSSVSKAAINGGVSFIADMPNNPFPPINDASYSSKEKLAKKSDVAVLLYAAVGEGSIPLTRNVPYKVFMGQSIGDLFFSSDRVLEETLSNYKGKSVSFHCEDENILKENMGQPYHEAKRPREAEIKAIKRAINLIKKYNLDGKICHCSTYEGLELVKQAKHDKLNVTCEVTPHHLFFNDKYSDDKFLKMNPPLRKEKDRQALINGLKHGVVDYLATDHAPHLLSEKEKGMAGVPNLDTFSNIVAWLINDCSLTPLDISRVCSLNPGRFVSRFKNQEIGAIASGYIANLTVLNISKSKKITKDSIESKCGWSPFENFLMRGKVKKVFIEGKVF
ncbi:MAG: dihydroorotase [Nanobdellota archaeon]